MLSVIASILAFEVSVYTCYKLSVDTVHIVPAKPIEEKTQMNLNEHMNTYEQIESVPEAVTINAAPPGP